ncbi:hypothetical protein BCF58_0995 [Chryseobacterium defluvii]|uniref:Uncharacterized protein n=2 Tax=Chryseobacterium defluvii TaxID=160396 RepID=A0A495SNB1_9FLAO|nr:hypothetical protein BCF58_0995 [Chryseobacterium defluvii]
MDINSIIQVLASIFTVFISAFIAPFFLNFYMKRKFRKMQYLIDSQNILQNVHNDFKTNFVEPTIAENLFFVMTGIRTNYNTIPAYLKLKDLLGQDYEWLMIRSAKPHFKFDNKGEIEIILSKYTLIYRNFSLVLSFVFSLTGLGILIYFSRFDINTLSEILLIYMLAFPLFIFAFYILSTLTSISRAGILQKRLTVVKMKLTQSEPENKI